MNNYFITVDRTRIYNFRANEKFLKIP